MSDLKLYTVSEAAYALGVSYGQMHKLLSRGDVPYIRHGRRRKVKALALAAYIDSLDCLVEARRRNLPWDAQPGDGRQVGTKAGRHTGGRRAPVPFGRRLDPPVKVDPHPRSAGRYG